MDPRFHSGHDGLRLALTGHLRHLAPNRHGPSCWVQHEGPCRLYAPTLSGGGALPGAVSARAGRSVSVAGFAVGAVAVAAGVPGQPS